VRMADERLAGQLRYVNAATCGWRSFLHWNSLLPDQKGQAKASTVLSRSPYVRMGQRSVSERLAWTRTGELKSGAGPGCRLLAPSFHSLVVQPSTPANLCPYERKNGVSVPWPFTPLHSRERLAAIRERVWGTDGTASEEVGSGTHIWSYVYPGTSTSTPM
jgi:hypothetical protein